MMIKNSLRPFINGISQQSSYLTLRKEAISQKLVCRTFLLNSFCKEHRPGRAFCCFKSRCMHNDSEGVLSRDDLNSFGNDFVSSPANQGFGVIFDIDGVLVRGRHVISCARQAIEKLHRYDIPLLYLTNGGCETEEHKAMVLKHQLHIEVDPEQVVLSHSPLRVLNILHDKHVVVSGQGPVSEIAQMCGFSKVSHVDDVDQHFPDLDVNDRMKRFHMPPRRTDPFYPVEAILLMGEPVNWERSLQIIVDILLTNGVPNRKCTKPHEVHLPVVAINTDYLWMSEAANPRLGHGAFLLSLETVYQKLTGRKLEYTEILGKPNLFTYRYTEGVMLSLVKKKFGPTAAIKTMYGVGDNIDTDVYGANLYNNYLKALRGSNLPTDVLHFDSYVRPERMKSILVKTGVYQPGSGLLGTDVNLLHRDNVYRPEYTVPTHICENVLEAVNFILKENNVDDC